MNNTSNKNGNGNGRGRKPVNAGARRNGNATQKKNGNGRATLKALGIQGSALPLSYAMSNVRPIQNQKCRHAGSDFITSVIVKSDITLPTSRILAEFPISPSAFPGTRLTQFSQLYEFYKFVSLRLRYVPAVPVTLACQLVLYVDLDPTDDAGTITDADFLVRQAVAQTGAQQWNFHTPKVIPMAMRTDQQFYFTGNDKQNVRFTQQGKAYLIQVTQAVNVSGDPIASDIEAGSIFFDWVVDFNIPQLNPETSIVTSVTGETIKYFTDTPTGGAGTWEPSWLSAGQPIMEPRSLYLVMLRGDVLRTISASTSQSILVRVDGRLLGAYLYDVATDSISNASIPFVVTTNNNGIPTQKVEISWDATVGGFMNSLGLTIAPLKNGTSFPVLSGGSFYDTGSRSINVGF
jgi:hypothetical protein